VAEPGQAIVHVIPTGRHAWVQCASGVLDVNGVQIREGDGLAVSDESQLVLRGAGTGDSEFLLFDLA
jgi:redox-sensitive bicupin YhaK (pirin superfamily)